MTRINLTLFKIELYKAKMFIERLTCKNLGSFRD